MGTPRRQLETGSGFQDEETGERKRRGQMIKGKGMAVKNAEDSGKLWENAHLEPEKGFLG